MNNTMVLKSIKATLVKNTPVILTGIAVVGVISTAFFAIQATPKAVGLLGKLEEENPDANFVDKAKVLWKPYLPTIVVATITIAAIVESNRILSMRQKALVALYALTEESFKEYRASVVDAIGDKKEGKIFEDVKKKTIEKTDAGNLLLIGEREGALIYDSISGRYWKQDIEKIRQSINELNSALLREDYVNLNEFYYLIGLEPTKLGDMVGWKSEGGLLNVTFASHLTRDNVPCLVLNYDVFPIFL